MSEEANNNPRILAVDDSRVMRVAIRKILGKDYDVIEAEHGEDAWTLLTNDDSIQVVFTDLSMPYLDGYGLLNRMRTSTDERLQDMPVIIITGKEDDDEAKQQALDRGASDFISKPFESVQLIARAKAHVSHKQTTTKLNNTEAKLERQAAVDETTGLSGQRYFCKAADETLAYLKRHGGQYILVRMDLDNFNQIFIKNGKQFADEILAAIGKHLINEVREEDMLARIGLAKFAMLLRDTPIHKAEQLAKRIQTNLAELNLSAGSENTIPITMSIVVYEPNYKKDSDIKEQISTADKYLQALQEKGDNQLAVYPEIQEFSAEQVNIETALTHIRQDETSHIDGQAKALAKRLLPVLDFIASRLGDDVKELVDKLREKISS